MFVALAVSTQNYHITSVASDFTNSSDQVKYVARVLVAQSWLAMGPPVAKELLTSTAAHIVFVAPCTVTP